MTDSIPAIVDSHVHLWNPRRFRMPWIDGDAILEKPFERAEFDVASAGLNVEAIVFVQVDALPAYGLLEARWAAQQQVDGVVAWAPLEDGPVARSYLDELKTIGPRIKGVRRLIQSEADPDFPLRLIDAVRLLPGYGLSFDICIRHEQLARSIDLVRACPETRFVLDHLGKPGVKAGVLDPWRREIEALAQLPNVVCKVSGLVTEADHQRWTPADLAPYIRHVLDAFGEERVLFGGDWPVVNHAATYRRWVETLATFSTSAKLWRDNARRVYDL